MKVKDTSIKSFIEQTESGELSAKQKRVYEAFLLYGPHTNLEISQILGFPINQVTPRTNELVKLGKLKEIVRTQCRVSGRTAIVWGMA